MFVWGIGTVTVSVGIMVLFVGSVVVLLLEQPQAHKFSATSIPSAQIAIFFTRFPPYFQITTVVLHRQTKLDWECVAKLLDFLIYFSKKRLLFLFC